jgi:hypothetical protein
VAPETVDCPGTAPRLISALRKAGTSDEAHLVLNICIWVWRHKRRAGHIFIGKFIDHERFESIRYRVDVRNPDKPGVHGRPRDRVSGVVCDGKDHNTSNRQRLLHCPGQGCDGSKDGNHRKQHHEGKEIKREKLPSCSSDLVTRGVTRSTQTGHEVQHDIKYRR